MTPFLPPTLAALAQQYGTPLWVYDASTITRQVETLPPFDVLRFAQKANSNTHILRHMKRLGVLVGSVPCCGTGGKFGAESWGDWGAGPAYHRRRVAGCKLQVTSWGAYRVAMAERASTIAA